VGDEGGGPILKTLRETKLSEKKSIEVEGRGGGQPPQTKQSLGKSRNGLHTKG